MNATTSYLEKLGSNFLVAAMIPSLGLVIASIFVFDPILQVFSAFQTGSRAFPFFDVSILVIIPTVIIGYTLTALNTYILKFFEGYVFFHRFPALRQSEAIKANKLITEREELKRNIKLLEEKKYRSADEELSLNVLKTAYYATVATYDQLYPPTNAEIMPTQFGNILKASEAYSGTRYGMDAVQFWPRLWHVIPPSYQQTIVEARNELSFLVNMSTLSVIFYMLCILAILYNAPLPGTNPDWGIVLDNSIRYIIAGIFAFLANRFFNKAAIFSVGDFGIMIRSAYDLFRLDLLEQFRLKQPKDSVEEFQVWKNLGELLVLGQESLDFKPLKYEVKKGGKKTSTVTK